MTFSYRNNSDSDPKIVHILERAKAAILSSSENLTPSRLTAMLNESNLSQGRHITSIRCEPVAGQFGKSHQLYLIRIRDTEAGSQAHPNRFFLKLGKSSKEFFFYNTIARTMSSPPLLHCYYAAHDPKFDHACLLLEDLSETHFQTEWPLPPSTSLCFQIVQNLAQIHALWWQSPRLESEFFPATPPGRSWRDRRALAIDKLPAFLDFLGDRLSLPRRDVYERLLASPTRLRGPSTNAPHQTLLHGDMHVWNVFFPLDPGGSLYFFDWNMWDIGCPTDDLAYMIATHWYRERRERMEQDLLNVYHCKLVKYGITNYPWENFQYDYRLSVIRSLLIPIWQWVRGINPGIWWSHLERTFLAFEDLKCDELIE
jgi:hypothetical protein